MSLQRRTTKAATRWAIAAAVSWPAILSIALLALVMIILFSTAGPAAIPPSAAVPGNVACIDGATEAVGSLPGAGSVEAVERNGRRRPSTDTNTGDARGRVAVHAITCGDYAADRPTDFDPGNIISDAVFYNDCAFPDIAAVQTALTRIGASCVASTCLRLGTYTPGAYHVAWCKDWAGPPGQQSYASILFHLGKSCGINPQVAIVMVQKESQGLTRPSPPAALAGFGCPDTGPGGSANCDQGSAGVWAQTFGMFQAFARLRIDPSKVNYLEGRTHNILWNVAETGCGSAPVTIANRATATLYTYTPYQPNAASLTAYPGEGDACSSYGNRNFFRLFTEYFGSTGGGTPITAVAVSAGGSEVTIPDNAYVAPAIAGRRIEAPNRGVAKGLAAGFAALGMPYVWGGGGGGSGPNNGCGRGGGDFNSCGAEIGFDCSGLTAYVLRQAGFDIPGNSVEQRSGGVPIPWDHGQPGDIVGFPGHVAIYLGTIDGQRYILEASWVGTPIHVVPLTRTDYDRRLHRYWTVSDGR